MKTRDLFQAIVIGGTALAAGCTSHVGVAAPPPSTADHRSDAVAASAIAPGAATTAPEPDPRQPGSVPNNATDDDDAMVLIL